MSGKSRILFVDDEKRVLNAMRGLFRRRYELFLANSGKEALEIAKVYDIDVIVADQRMPTMTGIELLAAMRRQSPRTVRILLTGYADPNAIEGSINKAEVFRFLSKPCPPNLLRETLTLAIEAAGTRPVVEAPAKRRPSQTPPAARTSPPSAPAQPPQNQPAPSHTATVAIQQKPLDAQTLPPAANDASSAQVSPPNEQQPAHNAKPQNRRPPESEVSSFDETTPNLALDLASPPEHEVTDVVMSGEVSEETSQTSTFEALLPGSQEVGVVVFTVNSDFAAAVIRAVSDERSAIVATTLVKVAEAINHQNVGVLVTDFSSSAEILRKVVNALKQRLPELLTIVASNDRDSDDMINLINYGQIYRYLVKPVDPEQLRGDINSAVFKHMHLLRNPEAGKRHQVATAPKPEQSDTSVNKFLTDFRGSNQNSVSASGSVPTRKESK